MTAIAPTGPRARACAGTSRDRRRRAPRARARGGTRALRRASPSATAAAIAEFDGAGLGEPLGRDLGDRQRALARRLLRGLRRSVDVNDDEARDLEAVIEQQYVQVANTLRFFELEWIALDDDVADALADAPEVAGDRHHLRSLRRYRPHKLSEPEERIWRSARRPPRWRGRTCSSRRSRTSRSRSTPATAARPHDRRAAREHVRHRPRPAAARAGHAVRRRSSRSRRCSRTATTRSSPTASWTTGCAATRARWPSGTSRTSSRPRRSTR